MSDLPETTDGRDTIPPALAEGLALALAARDAGTPSPLVDWLARHPNLAGSLAAFLAGERVIESELPGVAVTAGGLEFRGVLGEGGMGVVHRAYDPRLNRDVAVKSVRPGADIARFRIEAETVAGLNHPNVVRVLAFGESGGRPFLVMPLLTGGSLAQRLKTAGPLPPREAAELVRDIAEGVHHAHRRGVIHRDLKPANVLLDEAGVPHVADFGLARRIDVSASTAAIVGTAAYMAPEQARGDRVLTTAIDVHALGAILYECLTGAPPFGGGDALAVMRRIAEEPAAPLRSRRPDAPADLEEVCRRCLEKEAEARYPSAQELADDLTRFLDGEPLGRHSGSWIEAVRRGLVRIKETDGMATWHIAIFNAAFLITTMGAWQIALLVGEPAWAGWAVMAFYLVAWGVLVWSVYIVRRSRLNAVERSAGLMLLGTALSCAACLPACDDPVRALPAFLAVQGVGIFAHGSFYWGRLYLVGTAYFALAALMPLAPPLVWPVLFGLWGCGVNLWCGLHLRRVHLAASGEAPRHPAGDDGPAGEIVRNRA